MTEYKTIVEKLKATVKEYGRMIFVLLAFFIGVYIGGDSNINTNVVIITISFLSGCLIVLLFIINSFNEEENEKEKNGDE